ncbi:hypothetical protein BKA83DRAFT_97304 [Pisolithus microcarpus]|nr:hypothetical protein BKA83DRAFT_97304 [Pisolithus microcarpus]
MRRSPRALLWYAPWSRYQAPSADVPSDGNASVNSASQQLIGQKLEPTVQEPIVPSIEGTGATGSIDPIQSSIAQNRTGWMSFFSARAMAMRREMEVMDIDEDVGAGRGSLPASSRGSPAAVERTDLKQQQKVTTVTTSEANIREVVVRQSSPSPSKKSTFLPTWEHIFHVPPRSIIPEAPSSTLVKALKSVTEALFARNEGSAEKGKGRRQGSYLFTPTGTSSKFVNRVVQALDEFQEKHKVKLRKITKIPLEGEGTINRRVEKLYQNLTQDAIFVATHSQGSIVSTHILDRLITDRHIRTKLNTPVLPGDVASPPQRPLRYLNTNSLLSALYTSGALRNVLDNGVSIFIVSLLRTPCGIVSHQIKVVYIASLNDQVVGLYSGLFTSVSHPLILRAIYIDGDAYHSSDFLSNLLALLLRIRNAGLSDSGLLTHLSEATAGSLNGIGHSTPYEELGTYTLAINYLFLANDGFEEPTELTTESFNALTEQNDYEIPWALRDLIADDRVTSLFSDELVGLRDAFRNWHPKTAIQRDLKRKLQPFQRLSASMISGRDHSMSKL